MVACLRKIFELFAHLCKINYMIKARQEGKVIFFWSFRNVTTKDKTLGYDQKFVQLNEE
jgi:hypothetical protein